MNENNNFAKNLEKIKLSEGGQEAPLSLDSGVEKKAEAMEKAVEKVLDNIEPTPVFKQKRSSSVPASAITDPAEEKRNKEIEKFLSEGLENIYLNLPMEKRLKFKEEGEKTARQINILLNKTKIKIKKIAALIRKWLLIIPGVNKFFLEQEAKIRADKIIKLKK